MWRMKRFFFEQIDPVQRFSHDRFFSTPSIPYLHPAGFLEVSPLEKRRAKGWAQTVLLCQGFSPLMTWICLKIRAPKRPKGVVSYKNRRFGEGGFAGSPHSETQLTRCFATILSCLKCAKCKSSNPISDSLLHWNFLKTSRFSVIFQESTSNRWHAQARKLPHPDLWVGKA